MAFFSCIFCRYIFNLQIVYSKVFIPLTYQEVYNILCLTILHSGSCHNQWPKFGYFFLFQASKIKRKNFASNKYSPLWSRCVQCIPFLVSVNKYFILLHNIYNSILASMIRTCFIFCATSFSPFGQGIYIGSGMLF